MMAREIAKKKWTDQQLLFISQLHLFTVMMMTGGVKVIDRGENKGDKEIVIDNQKLDKPKPENRAITPNAKRSRSSSRAFRDAGAPAKGVTAHLLARR